MWSFILDSDTHAHIENATGRLRIEKSDVVERIKKINLLTPIDFVVCAGDLTSNGREPELRVWLNKYYNKLQTAGIMVKACVGNHDFSTQRASCCTGVPIWTASEFGATRPLLCADSIRLGFSPWGSGAWSFAHHGVKFLCCACAPNFTRVWLKHKLLHTPQQQPVIIWFHYNINIDEAWADMWTTKNKAKFWQDIKNHNVIAILTGHNHSTQLNLWHDIPVIRGAGRDIARIVMNGTALQDVQFINTRSYSAIAAFDRQRRHNTLQKRLYDAKNSNTRDSFLPQ